ncbi:MAG TPA: triose-phosphate isomerase [Gemmatimonadaceae bacterium]|nr:triose-phosphate isomerase [Gemmatimonadaceae bacterium]
MNRLRRPVFAANWKMHHGPTDGREFMRTFLAHFPRHSDRTLIFFPPAATISAVHDALRERSEILIGVQNIHWEDKGAFTGEISASIARDAGAYVALVGHSERRHVFGETDEETGKKVAAALRARLTPMLCVGETLAERERGATEEVVLRQLAAGLAPVDAAHALDMAIAYEPVWAIGTGKNATPEDASAMHAVIRRYLAERLGDRAKHTPVIYGGSVNRGNAASLLAARDVDGLLVGGASLDAVAWTSIAST